MENLKSSNNPLKKKSKKSDNISRKIDSERKIIKGEKLQSTEGHFQNKKIN